MRTWGAVLAGSMGVPHLPPRGGPPVAASRGLRPVVQCRVQTIEERHPVGQCLLVVLERRQESPNRQVDPPRLVPREFLIPQVDLVDDLGQMGQSPITLSEASDQSLERAILALMPELDAGGVERDRVGGKVLRGG